MVIDELSLYYDILFQCNQVIWQESDNKRYVCFKSVILLSIKSLFKKFAVKILLNRIEYSVNPDSKFPLSNFIMTNFIGWIECYWLHKEEADDEQYKDEPGDRQPDDCAQDLVTSVVFLDDARDRYNQAKWWMIRTKHTVIPHMLCYFQFYFKKIKCMK